MPMLGQVLIFTFKLKKMSGLSLLFATGLPSIMGTGVREFKHQSDGQKWNSGMAVVYRVGVDVTTLFRVGEYFEDIFVVRDPHLRHRRFLLQWKFVSPMSV
ncbi:hypothetical protein ACLOJK_033293 [Asimina triloba]